MPAIHGRHCSQCGQLRDKQLLDRNRICQSCLTKPSRRKAVRRRVQFDTRIQSLLNSGECSLETLAEFATDLALALGGIDKIPAIIDDFLHKPVESSELTPQDRREEAFAWRRTKLAMTLLYCLAAADEMEFRRKQNNDMLKKALREFGSDEETLKFFEPMLRVLARAKPAWVAKVYESIGYTITLRPIDKEV